MIGGFDELILKCGDDDARSHVREAIKCYEGGAYRAAIISAYIAVCFDLIAKLRSLAAEGDGSAKKLISDLEKLHERQSRGDPNAIQGLLSFERNLLEEFRDSFEFFGAQEFDELARLRTDRNKCAHPTFFNNSVPYSPSAELARLHIRNSLYYVLSQMPKQGKAALKSLSSTILSPYFPEKVEDVVDRLRNSELGSARDGLVRAFIDDVVFGWPDKSNPYYHKASALRALHGVIEISRPVALPRLVSAIDKIAKSSDVEATQLAGGLCARFPEAAESVSEATKVVLKNWLRKETSEEKGKITKRALLVAWWKDVAKEVIETLSDVQIGKITDAPAEIVTRAAKLYCKSKSWDEANSLAVNCIIPFADRFSKGDVEMIFAKAASGEADLKGSHSFRDFVTSLYSENPISPDDLGGLLDKYDLEYYKK